MAFARLHSISVAYGDRDVLNNVTLSIDSQSRIALAGDNGSGKTTLLRIAAGLAKPDSGSVQLQRDCVTAYLPQSGLVYANTTLAEEADLAFERFHLIESEKSLIEENLSRSKAGDRELESLLHEHDELQQELVASGFYERDQKIRAVLLGLGFASDEFAKKTEEFSGGWQMRIGLAKVLLANPDIVLLDEPTNYLDIEARTWLEEFLSDFPGGVVIVSHDRYFLDVTMSMVAELFGGGLKLYPGNYTSYINRRAVELDSLLDAFRQQQREIERIESFVRRFRSKPTKASQVQSRVKQLEKLERIEIPETMKRIAFRFPEAPHSGKIVLRSEDLGRRYCELQVFKELSFVLERGDRLVLAGRNGAGKSTLMRILAGRDGGHTGTFRLGAGVKIGYFSQDLDSLPESGTVLEAAEASAETNDLPRLRDLLGSFLFRGDDVFKQLGVLSGGERSRLALLLILLHPVNLLILDEPTNHLDMASKNVLLSALKDFGGTLIFVSHDRYFIEAVAERVLELGDGEWKLYPGDYEYYLWRTAGGEAADDTAPGGAEIGTIRNQRDAEELQSDTRRDEINRGEEKELKRRLRQVEASETALFGQLERCEEEHEICQSDLSIKENYTNGEVVQRLTLKLKQLDDERAKLHEKWSVVDSEIKSIRERLKRGGRDA